MVIRSLMPLILLSGMEREEDSESQNSTFSMGVKGGGVGGRSIAINGRKTERDELIVVDAGAGASGNSVGVGVSVAVGMVVAMTLVGEEVTVGVIVSVIRGESPGVSVLEGVTGVVSTVGVREISSVVAI